MKTFWAELFDNPGAAVILITGLYVIAITWAAIYFKSVPANTQTYKVEINYADMRTN